MMMTEVAGGLCTGGERSSSPSPKGKAFNLMRHHSSSIEDSVMTTFMNNNNNNNTLDPVDRASPFSNHSGSNGPQSQSQGKGGDKENSAAPIQMHVEVHGNSHHNRDVEMEKKVSSEKEDSPAGPKQNFPGEESSSEDLSLASRGKENFHQNQEQQQHQAQHLMTEESHRRSIGGEDEEEDEEDGMMILDEQEGYSDDGEMMPGEEDSDKDEHRFTVRELMSRAYQSAAAAAKYGHNRHSHSTQVRKYLDFIYGMSFLCLASKHT